MRGALLEYNFLSLRARDAHSHFPSMWEFLALLVVALLLEAILLISALRCDNSRSRAGNGDDGEARLNAWFVIPVAIYAPAAARYSNQPQLTAKTSSTGHVAVEQLS